MHNMEITAKLACTVTDCVVLCCECRIMCGIWAIFSSKGDIKIQCTACHKIAHRGPDAFKIESIPEFPNSCLGFHRLEINDASGGMQPMRILEYPHVKLIYNGEIYNFWSLQKKYGFNYQTKCDGEAIIHLYVKFGAEEAARLLDGVFAFVIIDTKENKIHIGRDVFGIKPLYTFHNNGVLGVCSEAKGLIDVLNDGASIHLFPCGHIQTYLIDTHHCNGTGTSLLETKRFLTVGEIDPSEVVSLHPTDLYANIRALIKDAVKKRLLSNRRIGCFLSGGLDSSLIAALVVQLLKEEGCPYKVQTFTIGSESSPDLIAARKMADHLGTEHHEVRFNPEEGFEAMHSVIHSLENFDTLTIRGSIGLYMLSKYIKENTDSTVLFCGEGADELCQGYIYFKQAPSAMEAHKDSIRLLEEISLFDVLRAERMTSAHGLEMRVPFLDKYLTSYYLSLPPEIRQPQNGVEKHLLRKVFSNTGLLPDEILWRHKEGMSDGLFDIKKSWFTILHEHINEKVDEGTMKEACQHMDGLVPKTKEGYYYRKVFEEKFPNCHNFTPKYWMPKWIEVDDPSSRAIKFYAPTDI